MLLNFDRLVENYKCNIKGILHIGGHYGEEHSIYKKHNIKNIIYFEPSKSSFSVLKQNIGDAAILVNKALGNENKTITLNVEKNNQGQSSSLLKPKLHLEQYPGITFTDTEEVDMIRLDDYEYDRNNFNFINIDVQGYELEVFKGASKTLKNIDYIISEVNRAEVYENCVMVEDLYNFLHDYGFEIKEVNWAGHTWGDAFFVKERQ